MNFHSISEALTIPLFKLSQFAQSQASHAIWEISVNFNWPHFITHFLF